VEIFGKAVMHERLKLKFGKTIMKGGNPHAVATDAAEIAKTERILEGRYSKNKEKAKPDAGVSNIYQRIHIWC